MTHLYAFTVLRQKTPARKCCTFSCCNLSLEQHTSPLPWWYRPLEPLHEGPLLRPQHMIVSQGKWHMMALCIGT